MKRLYLSRTDRKISGVCGGIAEFYGLDSSLVRLGWVVLTVMTGGLPGLIGYFVAGIVIPNRPSDT